LEALETRIEELESQLAFQEDALEQFNAVVTRQQGQIDNLTGQIKYLQDQLLEAASSLQDVQSDPAQERPPHY
jgi:SlyX protein